MRVAIVREPGPPEVIHFESIECPQPEGGWVLIEVAAVGLNRSDAYARAGHYPTMTFPRVLGVECVGTVREDPNGLFAFGQKVAAFGGGIGTAYNGTYARFACVREEQVVPLASDLDWQTLATIPQAYLTAWWVLKRKLGLEGERSVLIRGGSSAVGMAAITIGKALGLHVLATTRNPAKRQRLLDHGADAVLLDSGAIAEDVRAVVVGGVDGVVELVGPSVFADSLRACVPGGVVCATGALGATPRGSERQRLGYLLEHVKLIEFNLAELGRVDVGDRLQGLVDDVASGRLSSILDRVMPFDELVDAHRVMEASGACGKIVLTMP